MDRFSRTWTLDLRKILTRPKSRWKVVPWRRKWKKRSKRRENIEIRSGRRGIQKWGVKPWGQGKGPKKILKKFIFGKSWKNNVLKILTWWVGAAVEIGIFDCAMLVKSSSRILLALRHLEEWILVMEDFECWVCVCDDDVKATWLVVIRKDTIGRYEKGCYWCSVCGSLVVPGV